MSEIAADQSKKKIPAHLASTVRLPWAGQCPHCDATPPQAEKGAFCESCMLRVDLLEGHHINRARQALYEARQQPATRERAPASTPAAGPAAAADEGPGAAAVLTNRVGEAARAQRIEPGWPERPEFAADAPSPSLERAAQKLRRHYKGSTFMHPPTELVDLVRSGRLRDVGLAVPRTYDEADAITAAGASRARAREACDPPDAESRLGWATMRGYEDYVAAVTGTILPALIDRPAAMLEWCTLSATIALITREYGWPLAAKYLTTVLRQRSDVPEEKSIGAFSWRIWCDVGGTDPGARAAPPGDGSADQMEGVTVDDDTNTERTTEGPGREGASKRL